MSSQLWITKHYLSRSRSRSLALALALSLSHSLTLSLSLSLSLSLYTYIHTYIHTYIYSFCSYNESKHWLIASQAMPPGALGQLLTDGAAVLLDPGQVQGMKGQWLNANSEGKGWGRITGNFTAWFEIISATQVRRSPSGLLSPTAVEWHRHTVPDWEFYVCPWITKSLTYFTPLFAHLFCHWNL